MGLVFTAVVYVAGYLFLLFVAVCLACGLYYLAELAEEYTSLTRKLISLSITAVLICHVLFFLFEELPRLPLAVGFAAHACYFVLLRGFPFLRLLSPSFLVSVGMLITSNYLWIRHFTAHYHQLVHVFCFFVFNVWLAPFGFFVSLSINEAVLPDRLASTAAETYSEGGRTKSVSGIKSAFNYMQEKKEDLMPSTAKRV
ncbi:hypothetical protein AB1Y20_021494 [Prymnesium parvum]|uniref:Protein TEX261 n=1 Tax=Prymnesium parvum TaxID=97485 RepID=A0AB34JLP9_PRYPA